MREAATAIRNQPERWTGFTGRQWATLAAPPLLVVTTYLAFQVLVDLWGPRWGYLSGFLFFWVVWCWGFTLWAIGRNGVAAVLRQARPRLPRPRLLWLGLLAFPIVGGLLTVLLPDLPDATIPIVMLALVIAAVNATSEELLWRGVFIRLFSGRPVLGWLYPAAWFALWHISPTSIRGSTSVLVFAGLYLGLVYGWIALRTSTIRYTIVAHFLVNSMGLGFASLLLHG